jgi:hypothetical protein
MANSANSYVNATFVKLIASQQTITGDLAITGNLTLLGNATSISSNNLIVGDSLIYLAANNYSGTDIVDIGFLANYANGTGANVHTGLVRDATTKQYYLFQGLDIELYANNTAFTPYANGVVNSVLNADLITSNLTLGGANAINSINAAFTQANTVAVGANNYAGVMANAVNNYTNTSTTGANNYSGYMANAVNTYTSTTYTTLIQYGALFGVANAAYTQNNLIFGVANASFTYANNLGYFAGNNGNKGNAVGLGDIFRVHSNTLTQNVTIYGGNNAVCVGPLNLASNVSLIILTGARVAIV